MSRTKEEENFSDESDGSSEHCGFVSSSVDEDVDRKTNDDNFNLSDVNAIVEQIESEEKVMRVKSLAELAASKLNEVFHSNINRNGNPTIEDSSEMSAQFATENGVYNPAAYENCYKYDGFGFDQNYDLQMVNPQYVYPQQIVPPTYSQNPSQTAEAETTQSPFTEVSFSEGAFANDSSSQYFDASLYHSGFGNPQQECVSNSSNEPILYQYIGQDGVQSSVYNVNAPAFYPSNQNYNVICEENLTNYNALNTESLQVSCGTISSETQDDANAIKDDVNSTQTDDVALPMKAENKQNSDIKSKVVKFGAIDPIMTPGNMGFQYPSIYVSDSGLITVLVKHDVSIEMTVDLAIRLVSHQHQLIAATNNRGNATYLSHPAAKIAQDSTTTEAEMYHGRRAKMTSDLITFANQHECYRFDNEIIDHEHDPKFATLLKDNSVSYLFQSAKLGSDVVPKCVELISQAEYRVLNRGGFTVKINGMKITQTNRGDVSVLCGPKFLRLSPSHKQLTVQTHLVEISVDSEWVIDVQRGYQLLYADQLEMQVANKRIEAGFDQDNRVYANTLPDLKPLPIGCRRQNAVTPTNRLRRRRRNLSREY